MHRIDMGEHEGLRWSLELVLCDNPAVILDEPDAMPETIDPKDVEPHVAAAQNVIRDALGTEAIRDAHRANWTRGCYGPKAESMHFAHFGQIVARFWRRRDQEWQVTPWRNAPQTLRAQVGQVIESAEKAMGKCGRLDPDASNQCAASNDNKQSVVRLPPDRLTNEP